MADDYYVSQVDGSDAYNGLYPTYQGGSDGPWLTCAKVDSSSFIPDDFIYFRRGGVWRETLDVNDNGSADHPITIKDYESGDIPWFIASEEATGFELDASNKWYATGYAVQPDMVWFIETDDSITWGDEKASKVALENEYDFWWDSGNEYLWVYAETDPDTRYNSVEASSRGWAGSIVSQHHLDFENLRFSFADTDGLRLRGEDPSASHCYDINVTGCYAHHNEVHGFKANQDVETGTVTAYDIIYTNCEAYYNGFHGFQASDGSGTITFDTCISHHNGQVDPNDCGFRFGETVTGLLKDSESYNNSYGVEMEGAESVPSDITVEGCDLHDNNYGILYYTPNDAWIYDGMIVRRCMIYNNATRGILVQVKVTNAEFYYNLIYENPGGGLYLMPNSPYTGDAEVYNNVFDDNGNNSLQTWTGSTIPIKNNIFNDYSLSLGSGTLDYNCFWPDDYGGKGANGINQDPKFVNPGANNYHLQSDSPCRNEGVDVSLTPDYDGVSVPQETYPAMGAFEYVTSLVNLLYANGREAFLAGDIDWAVDTIKVALIDLADYTVALTTHDYLDDISSDAIVAISDGLAGKSTTNGIADANDIVISGVSGDELEAMVLFKDTGVTSTSPLIVYIENADGFPFTPNGGNLRVKWNDGASKIFKL